MASRFQNVTDVDVVAITNATGNFSFLAWLEGNVARGQTEVCVKTKTLEGHRRSLAMISHQN